MATSQTEVENQAVSLSEPAFNAFCEDIAGMFGVQMQCKPLESDEENLDTLKERFNQVVAVNSVEAEGALNGTFQLIFDQQGLFILGGVIVMLPQKKILEDCKRGSIEDVKEMSDAIGEMGNLLVGSWDKIFREQLEGHAHFKQKLPAFVGDPWENLDQIDLTEDEELTFIPYEITVGSYPAFQCGVIFPKSLFHSSDESDAEQTETQEDTEQQAPQPDGEQTPTAEDTQQAQDGQEQQAEPAADTNAEEQPQPSGDSEAADPQDQSPQAQDSPGGEVSQAIENMIESGAELPGKRSGVILTTSAEDIMDKDVVWASPDDSIEQAVMKMQQHDTGYLLIGDEETLEGIVSNSDIRGAISPYLRPIFEKWRRPVDDASLKIKVKWIMTRPVRTITPDTSLNVIMEIMCQSAKRCLPVIDNQGKAIGLITVFDIFKAMLGTTFVGKTPQAPQLI